MRRRFLLSAVVVVLVVLVAAIFWRQGAHLSSDASPRSVAAPGKLTDAEQSIVALFERVSPSVVQVVGRQGGSELLDEEGGAAAGVQSRDRIRVG
jgi:2-alkenal reductase